MATLEVHDEQGRVNFVELAQDHPVLFGTSAACDIVLTGEGVLPVHGRIRWKKKKYKVEASPDAQFVLLNGKRMAESSLYQGDELTVGVCRIFVFRMDEAHTTRTVARPRPRPDEERTVFLEGGVPPAVASQGRKEASESLRSRSKPPESLLERAEWLEALELDSKQAAEATEITVSTRRSRGRKFREAPEASGWWPPAPFRKALHWVQELREGKEPLPGQERLITSPLVVGLLLTLALLMGLGLSLRTFITRTMATRSYDRALGLMEDGDYRTAIREFDAFLSANPDDPRIGKAQVFRALSNVRQFISMSGTTWSSALEAAKEMHESLGSVSEYRDQRPELGDLVIRIGEGLADRARRGSDPKALAEAESSVPLHAAIAGESAPAFLKKSRLPGLLSDARAAVRKAEVRADALAAMDRAISDGSAARVYQARDGLVSAYADLGQDRELIRRMLAANDLIRRAVKIDATHRAAETTARPEAMGPVTTLVMRSSVEVPSPSSVTESIAYALAEGMAVGVETTSGAPLWQVPVGLSSPFVPQGLPGEPAALAFDVRHAELLRLDARTGRLAWRLGLGERVEAPPLVLGSQIFQVLPSGHVVVISLQTGEREATIQLGLPAAMTPASDESGRFLYVVGKRDCLFVLARDSLSCVAVEYLGHEDGSIPCAPARLGRFLIIPENDRSADSRWRVLVLDDEGAKPRQVQQVEIAGWTWGTPASSGSYLWATGDRAGVEAFALGDYAGKTPLRPLAKLNPDAASSGPAFALSVSERELWLAGGRAGRYELDPERGEITLRSPLGPSGPALAPIQVAGRRVVLSFQDPATGGTSLWAADAASGSVAWRTILGAAWPTALTNQGGELATIDRTGREARIDQKQLLAGGFVTLPLPRSGDVQVPPGRRFDTGDDAGALTVVAAGAGSDALWVQDSTGPKSWRKIELPAPCAAMPLAWGRGILIPASDGRVYLIDPQTGRSMAEPLVPEFDRDRQGVWLAPARIDGQAVALVDDAGRVRRLALKSEPVPRLAVEAERLLDKPIQADPATTGSAIIVATSDGKIRALAARDLSPVGAWALDAPLVGSPVSAGDRGFAFDASGGILAMGRDGRRIWTAKLEAAAAGAPLVANDSVWVLDREGRLYRLALADGALRGRYELGVLPAGGLISFGELALVPVARGMLQPINLELLSKNNP